MTTTMVMMTGRPDWQPGHIPRLSYRNAAPSESPKSSDQTENNPLSIRIPPSSSIREIRESLPTSPASMMSTRTIQSQPAARKKSSLFGGLFVKEPSMAALDLVAAQMIDKHGAATPSTVPYVSSAKMPQHVPKVNSKWDGVPEAVKAKEKQTRESTKALNRNSYLPGMINKSQSTGVSDEKPPLNRLSTVDSWDSRSSGSRPVFQDNPPRTSSFSSTSTDDPDEKNRREASVRSQSLRSPSGNSLPEITAFFPADTLASPKSDPRNSNISSSNTYSPNLVGGLNSEQSQGRIPINSTGLMVPDPSTSTPVTPLSQFAPASFPILNDQNMDTTTKRQGLVIPADVTIPTRSLSSKRKSALPYDAFLAGEARPLELSDDESGAGPMLAGMNSIPLKSDADSVAILQQDIEKRPDSSRARLGLRASMVVRTDGAPWDSMTADTQTSQSPRSPTSPRTKYRLFGKDRI